jgi:predicted nucleic acid-binding protein
MKRTIYFDVCCLNRPFDDWSQERIRLEGEAVVNIAARLCDRDWHLVNSEAIAAELDKMTDLEKLESVREILNMATIKVGIDDGIKERSQTLENLGFGLYDSFHIACAERATADVLLTTDVGEAQAACNIAC